MITESEKKQLKESLTEAERDELHDSGINFIKDPQKLKKAIPLFYLAGMVSAFLGIGGGPINTPVLYEVLKLPIYNATAGSTCIILFNAIFNLIIFGIRGQVDWILGGIMGSGLMVGAYLAAKLASKVSRWFTMSLLSILLVAAGTKMIIG